MPSQSTHCHRIVTVLCLVCLLVAVVDGLFEQKGSTNYWPNYNTVACRKNPSLSIWSCPLCFCESNHTLKKGDQRQSFTSLQCSFTLAAFAHIRQMDRQNLTFLSWDCASSKNTIVKAKTNLDILWSILVKISPCPRVCAARSVTQLTLDFVIQRQGMQRLAQTDTSEKH